MVDFIRQLRELCGGKPVGIKLCIGRTEEFAELCRIMAELGMVPTSSPWMARRRDRSGAARVRRHRGHALEPA